MNYDDDDVQVVNPHRRAYDGLGNVAPQIFGMGIDLHLPELNGTALCASVDPELFFPPPGNYAQARLAKAICRGCPIIAWCRETHLSEITGVWGGLDVMERRALRKSRRSQKLAATRRIDLPKDLDTCDDSAHDRDRLDSSARLRGCL